MILAVFETFRNLPKFKTVAERLNADGHRTSNGAELSGQSVARILRDKTHFEDSTIPQDLWDEVQAILAAKERGGNAKRRVAHLCSGLLRCGCGQTMYVPTNSKKYVCPKCRNKISKDDMEAIIVENLRLSGNEKVSSMVTSWKSLTFEQKREMVESSVQNIIAEDKKVTLTLFAFG